jgi:hypothetical protein
MAVWNDKVVAVKQHEGYVVQRLTGEKDDFGMITIPWKELCTVTFIKEGEVHVVNEAGKILGKLSPGRFHYSLVDLDNKKEVDYKNAAKATSVDGYIPTKEELEQAAAQKQIKLVSLSKTDFYCISDPTGERIWDGDIYTITKETPYHDINPEQLKRLIPLDNGITLNNEEMKIHKVTYTDVYDEPFRVSGIEGSKFIVFKHVGFIKHITQSH